MGKRRVRGWISREKDGRKNGKDREKDGRENGKDRE
jgi:hypothetical protein